MRILTVVKNQHLQKSIIYASLDAEFEVDQNTISLSFLSYEQLKCPVFGKYVLIASSVSQFLH